MTSYWLMTNHTMVLHGLMAVAAVCYALMLRDIAQEVRGLAPPTQTEDS
ncbi:hypothetical protein AB0H36_46510 [Kribbella sp. NPDC050820]